MIFKTANEREDSPLQQLGISFAISHTLSRVGSQFTEHMPSFFVIKKTCDTFFV